VALADHAQQPVPGDSALIAMSTMMRKAKVASCSMVRSRPMATTERSRPSSTTAAPP